MKNVDILFVSNFSDNLDKRFEKVSAELLDTTYMILTYRKTALQNSYSYEEFLEKNFDHIQELDSYDLSKKYKSLTLFLPIVGERFISNFFFGTENAFGNKKLQNKEIDFFIKSFILFLEEYIPHAKMVFSGYTDNAISILAYYLSEYYNKRCLTFHGISLIDMESCYITETFFCKPCEDLVLEDESEIPEDLLTHIKQYDIKKHIKDLHKKKEDFKKPVLGILSQNLFDMAYIEHSLKGYEPSRKELKVYMNIDTPDIVEKFKANLGRVYNKIIYKNFIKKSTIEDHERFIYFPLQLQPEASTGAVSPLIMNQLYVIENIAKCMPLGMTLVVKEHPVAVGMRHKNFYELIKRIPRVKLVKDDYSGKDLVKESQVVVGYGGTTLFECISNKKKILLLSKDYMYTNSSLVKISKSFDFLHEELVDFLEQKISDTQIDEEIQKMLEFFYIRKFPLYEEFERNIAKCLNILIKKV